MSQRIQGFSKLTKTEKIDWITQTHFKNPEKAKSLLSQYWNKDSTLQNRHDEFIENTLSNFYLPLGVAPNFLINGVCYTLPMVIEESSVVAAASNAAKFWYSRGGFKTEVLNNLKVGQIHFLFKGESKLINSFFEKYKSHLLERTSALAKNMKSRGGGIQNIVLKDQTTLLPNYYQLHLNFKTADAMGANFINSCLETIANEIEQLAEKEFKSNTLDVVMSILSNYVPDCLVSAAVQCPVSDLSPEKGGTGEGFAKKIIEAVNIAKKEPYRAVTHNKGIMNGVDALVLATGNDFRAVEAGVHAYAAKHGQYTSLSDAWIEGDLFHMKLTLPLALGTVGGLTKLHPMVQWNLELLGNPSAEELMQLCAAAGLAQNFAALRSLVTSGIQKGHMKMHLLNILNQFEATEYQKTAALDYFKNHTVSVQAVSSFLKKKNN